MWHELALAIARLMERAPARLAQQVAFVRIPEFQPTTRLSSTVIPPALTP